MQRPAGQDDLPKLHEVALNYVYNLFSGASRLINALIGGDPAETLSSRAGKSIATGGWAAHAPWPWWLHAHFIACIDWRCGGDAAARRRVRY